ncbi:hypothetical protein [Ekhidna sp.]|uniref:hypothetical protein n=1 Tax=Ekhidna sp. TaxID=2608089 RepID=UPI0032EAF0C1
MNIEQTKDEILIRVPKSTDLNGVERLLEFIRFREIASKSNATDDQIDELANQSKNQWWDRNKDRFVK